MEQPQSFKNVRVGVFDRVERADQAIRELRAAGFGANELSVLCSGKHLQKHFANLPKPPQAQVHSPQAMAAGGAVGASIGGLALAASALVTGGATLLIGGALLVAGGAIAGSFAGAIYGIERARADYYERALETGKILVVVECHEEDSERRLDEAARTFERAGANEVEVVGGYP